MDSPIGIFDSGIGGLTVARAIKDLLPQESIVYFGDTAHLPYGDKSAAAIQAYALRICDYLLQKRCKVILIACNSAATAAYDLVCQHVGSQAAVLSVIDPMVGYIGSHFQEQTIGLIGTQQTVQSGVYTQKIQALGQGIKLQVLATPLLVPMIEAGFTQDAISQEVIHNYLRDARLQQIKALVLGCTHYPVIKAQLQDFYQGQVAILDAAFLTAQALRQWLVHHRQLSTNAHPEDHFVVSDLTPAFEAATRLFFRQPVRLECLPA